MAPNAVTFVMAFHCHQPVGNFGWVIREAFERAYQPFIERLERHPTITVALHYTGCLLDWLEQEEPQFLRRVAQLVDRGQVEMIGGGYFEPILPLIPERDRQGQLQRLSEKLVALFGQRPCGAWLAERVWEPQLAATLARAGFDYTIVDDTHIRAAQGWSPALKEQQDIFGVYLTEDAGQSIRLFPSSKRLRYGIPFHLVQETMTFLRSCPRGAIVTFADDGEKFGLWPGTHQWVYEEGWLEQWFTALEQSGEWLTLSSFRDVATSRAPSGQVYLPCVSYDEMMEWSGGFFRNFLIKYPEANLMHKRMLEISQRLCDVASRGARTARARGAAATNGRQNSRRRLLERARRELYQAQCNCSYWHGVFGGLYLRHLRQGIYRHLLAAEGALDAVDSSRARSFRVTSVDVNGDGQAEVKLTTPRLQVIVAPAQGAAVIECDARDLFLNLGNTLRRQPEAYHATLTNAKPALLQRLSADGEHPNSIHELLGAKEAGLESLLVYDRYPRWSGLEHLLATRPELEQLRTNAVVELADPLGAYRCRPEAARRAAGRSQRLILDGERLVGLESPERHRPACTADAAGRPVLRLRKRVELHPREPRWSWRLHLSHVEHEPWSGWLGVEWNLSLRDQRYASPRLIEGVSSLTLEDPDQHVRVTWTLPSPLDCFTFPVETVSGSEEGLERTYQGLCVWWGSAAHCAPEAPWELTLTQSIDTI